VYDTIIGRQPVLDREQVTYAYELLFKTGWESLLEHEAAQLDNEDKLLNIETIFKQLSSSGKVFIPFTQKLLLEGYWAALPKELTIIQLLESVYPTPEVVETCRIIKDHGYQIALDEFRYKSAWEPIIQIADILKIDIQLSSRQEVEAYAKRYASQGKKLLASKVDSLKDYYWTEKLGYTFFQGYFFNEPEIIRTESVPTSRLTKFRLIQAVNKNDFDFQEAEDLIKHDPGLVMRLLKYVNSASMGLRNEVTGIRQALTLIGQQNLRKWISILAVSSFTDKKPTELMHLVVKRGQFCELLAEDMKMKEHGESLFLVGLFSLLDAIIDQPMAKVLNEFPLQENIKKTIAGSKTLYTDVLKLAITFETGDWNLMTRIMRKYDLEEKKLISKHIAAIEWAENFVD